jgi:hypothetical protein
LNDTSKTAFSLTISHTISRLRERSSAVAEPVAEANWQRAIRTPNWRYVEYPDGDWPYELYDLDADSLDLDPVVDDVVAPGRERAHRRTGSATATDWRSASCSWTSATGDPLSGLVASWLRSGPSLSGERCGSVRPVTTGAGPFDDDGVLVDAEVLWVAVLDGPGLDTDPEQLPPRRSRRTVRAVPRLATETSGDLVAGDLAGEECVDGLAGSSVIEHVRAGAVGFRCGVQQRAVLPEDDVVRTAVGDIGHPLRNGRS